MLVSGGDLPPLNITSVTQPQQRNHRRALYRVLSTLQHTIIISYTTLIIIITLSTHTPNLFIHMGGEYPTKNSHVIAIIIS